MLVQLATGDSDSEEEQGAVEGAEEVAAVEDEEEGAKESPLPGD